MLILQGVFRNGQDECHFIGFFTCVFVHVEGLPLQYRRIVNYGLGHLYGTDSRFMIGNFVFSQV